MKKLDTVLKPVAQSGDFVAIAFVTTMKKSNRVLKHIWPRERDQQRQRLQYEEIKSRVETRLSLLGLFPSSYNDEEIEYRVDTGARP